MKKIGATYPTKDWVNHPDGRTCMRGKGNARQNRKRFRAFLREKKKEEDGKKPA